MNRYQNPDRIQQPAFYAVEGTIVEMVPDGWRDGQFEPCQLLVTVEDESGNIVNFVVSSTTYVADYITLEEGRKAIFYYRTNAPAPLIFPPRYTAAVVVPEQIRGQMVNVGYYNDALINEEMTLQLKLDGSVKLRTANNQKYMGSPTGKELVVFYERSTRSIPAQTTPVKVVVLCS